MPQWTSAMQQQSKKGTRFVNHLASKEAPMIFNIVERQIMLEQLRSLSWFTINTTIMHK
jgi:hypothetical protein